jgi:hypothetical protein
MGTRLILREGLDTLWTEDVTFSQGHTLLFKPLVAHHWVTKLP